MLRKIAFSLVAHSLYRMLYSGCRYCQNLCHDNCQHNYLPNDWNMTTKVSTDTKFLKVSVIGDGNVGSSPTDSLLVLENRMLVNARMLVSIWQGPRVSITHVTNLMAAGGAFGGARGLQPIPPEKGVFPLDHFQECKDVMNDYLSCLKENKNEAEKCRKVAKNYLECRMEKKLMAKQDLGQLGFKEDAIIDSSVVQKRE